MGKIKKLPAEIVNLIAAGEVVERPASVVKELLENSLDAGASQIIIRVDEGGTKLIQISDNGQGMDAEDAKSAFEQHATSKISRAEDLHLIATLGFRGEALASIAAVSEVEMHTKQSSSDATKIIVDQQKITPGLSGHSEQGTTISIRNLFGSVPGRKKFLRTTSTEFSHLQNTVIEAALAHPAVRFELYHNDKLIFRLPAAADAAARATEIWPTLKKSDFYHSVNEGSSLKVEVWAGRPEVARKDRKVQFGFVNGRPVSDRLIQRAVADAYKGFIHRDLQPAYIVKLQLDPQEVDVNVHPRKQEVKFVNGQQVYITIMRTVRDLLAGQTKADLLTALGSEEGKETEANTPSFLRASANTPTRGKSVQKSISFTASLLNNSVHSERPAYLNQPTAGEELRQEPTAPSFITFRPLQLFNTYIVYQQGEAVIFIDQHAAAEKILYEKLMRQAAARSTPMLVPEILDFPAQDKAALLARAAELATLGLEIEDFSGNSIKVAAKPELTPYLRTQEFLQETLHAQNSFDDNPELLNEIGNPHLHHLVATAACHGSVRAGQRLSEPEMQQIISDLAKCEYPYNCPHGRPVSWQLSRTDLEKNFKRIL